MIFGDLAAAPVASIINVSGIQRLSVEDRSALYFYVLEAERNPDYVATIISLESGFKADAKNPLGSAAGLIQVIDSVARKQFGISSEELRKKSARWQIENVVSKWKWPDSNDVGDYYMSLFLPVFIGKPDDFVLGEADSSESLGYGLTKGKVYSQNYGFDTNKDGVFTVGDVKALARGRYNAAAKKPKLPVYPVSSLPKKSGGFPWFIVGTAAVAAVAYKITQRMK